MNTVNPIWILPLNTVVELTNSAGEVIGYGLETLGYDATGAPNGMHEQRWVLKLDASFPPHGAMTWKRTEDGNWTGIRDVLGFWREAQPLVESEDWRYAKVNCCCVTQLTQLPVPLSVLVPPRLPPAVDTGNQPDVGTMPIFHWDIGTQQWSPAGVCMVFQHEANATTEYWLLGNGYPAQWLVETQAKMDDALGTKAEDSMAMLVNMNALKDIGAVVACAVGYYNHERVADLANQP